MPRATCTLALLAFGAGCSFIDDYDRFHVTEDGADMGMTVDDGGGVDPDMEAPDQGPPPLTYETFLPMLFDGACRRMLHCERKLGLAVIVEPFFCNPSLEDFYLSAMPSPSVALDADQARACLEFLDTSDCSIDQSIFGSACDGLLEATSDIGFGEPCVPGARCAGKCVDDPTTCFGICEMRGASGAVCTDEPECNEGLVCRDGSCQAVGDGGDVCDEAGDCGALLWCSGSNVCEPLPDIGDACNTGLGGDPCRGQLFCVDDPAAPTDTCQPGGAIGDACTWDEPCQLGLRCASDRCVALSEPGGPCVSSENCPATFECIESACAPWGGIGDACDPLLPCVLGACVAGTCAWRLPGESCDPDAAGFSECESGCEETAPGVGTCNTPVPLGSSCTVDSVCEGEPFGASECLEDGGGASSCRSCT